MNHKIISPVAFCVWKYLNDEVLNNVANQKELLKHTRDPVSSL